MAGLKHGKILRHAQKAEIDKALLNQVPLRHIVAQYGTSTGTLERYRDDVLKGIPEEIRADPRVVEAHENATATIVQGFNSLEEVQADIEWAKWELKDIVQKAKEKGKSNIRAVEAIAKLAMDRLNAYMKYAELRQDHQALEDNAEYRNQIAKLLTALEPFPAARIAAAEALNE